MQSHRLNITIMLHFDEFCSGIPTLLARQEKADNIAEP